MNLTGILEVARLTDVGQVREHNEDAVAGDVELGLLVLADGLGGYQAGEVASEIAVLTIVAELSEALAGLQPGHLDLTSGMQRESIPLRAAVAKANAAIYEVSQSQSQCAGMATTVVLAMFTNDRVVVGHVGDSRLYRLRGEVFRQMTVDHSLLQEQLNFGLITPEQARQSNQKNMLTRALGIDPQVDLEMHEYDVQPGDIYLLCSDGLYDKLTDEDIASTLGTLGDNLELAAHQLVKMANDRGGDDNISVILARPVRPFPAEQAWFYRFTERWKTG